MWSLQQKWVRCGSKYCRACNEHAEARPHGPYFTLKRHRPGGGPADKDEIYIGSPRVHPWLTNHYVQKWLVAYLSVYWSGEEVPSRKFVLKAGWRKDRGLAVI